MHAYRLASGGALRASRALAALSVAVAATAVLMALWGLPDPAPKQTAAGTVPAPGGRIQLVIDKAEAGLSGTISGRWRPTVQKTPGTSW